MALSKKNEKGKCPFRKLSPCSDECTLFRKGVRYREDKDEAIPFESCALNIIADNLEAMHNRTFMMQRELGETKNVMAFKILSDLGIVEKEQAVRQAQAIINIPESNDKKLIK